MPVGTDPCLVLSKASASVCPFVWEFTPTRALMSVCWYWLLCECCKPPPACSLSHPHTYTERVHYIWLPPLKRAQGGFVGLWKGPRKMFSDKLFTVPQSLLGRVLHRTVWRITPSSLCLSLCLSLSLSLCCPPPSLSHSFNVPFFSRRLRFLISLPALFCMLQRWASRPQRRAQFLGKLSLIMAAINNMS